MKFLVLADVHGNATALEAVLTQERDFDSVVFLGDAVSPGPQPNETIELLTGLNGIFIQGNHERVMLNPSVSSHWPDGFKVLMAWIFDTFDQSGYEFLRTFELGGEFVVDGRTFVFTHGDENASVRHVLPDAAAEQFKPIARGNASSTVFFGHSHVQYRRTIGSQEFINPGSIGQHRCGRVTACYGLITDGIFTHHHVDYDADLWLSCVDRINPLKKFVEFRERFKQQAVTGFANGAIEPWTGYAKRGYL